LEWTSRNPDANRFKPRLTIVTPTYNAGKHLPAMIESVISQKGDFDIEHLIFDNCSIDNSRTILERYASGDHTVHVECFFEKDEGQSQAINKGFKLATGDLICWLNADETYEPDAIVKLFAFASEHPNVDVFFGDINFLNDRGEKIKTRKSYGFSRLMLLYYGCYIPSCATFMRNRVIRDGNLLDETFRVTMDFEYYLRLVEKNYVFKNFGATLANFSLRSDNVSVVLRERRRHERTMVIDSYSKLPKNRFIRSFLYFVLEYYWVIFRILQRKIYAYKD
jgi:glycosyltransferase involved in cell wall biosynthesis